MNARVALSRVMVSLSMVILAAFLGADMPKKQAEAPTFKATTLNGKEVHFPGDYKGKLVMVDFWATWCDPCMQQVPGLVKAYEEFHPQGLEILGVSLDKPDAAGQVKKLTVEKKMAWEQVYDGREFKGDIPAMYGITVIPTAFLIDGDTGRIVAGGDGSLLGDKRGPTIQAALKVMGHEPLPRKVSLVEEFDRLGLPLLQQGNQDSCGVFAVTSLVEFETERKAAAPHKPLSQAYIIWAACEVTGKTHEQSMFFEITAGLNKEGICTAEAMPYAKTFDLKRQPSAEALAESRTYQERWGVNWIRRWAYDPPLTDDQMTQIKRALADEHPVAIGVRWPSTNDNAKLESQLLTPPAPRELFDGHAIALVGYEDDAKRPGGGTFIFRNSFGPKWADHGYGTMSYAYARKFANDILWLQYGAPRSEVPAHHVEVEAMRQLATRRCNASEQDMSPWEGPLWSGGKQLYCQAEQGGSVELALRVPQAGRYRVSVLATAAPDYGVVRVELDGEHAGSPFDLYAGRVCPAGSLELGTFDLSAGQHRLLFTAADKNASSAGCSFGLDAVNLFTVADTK